MEDGDIVFSKSDVHLKPCPNYWIQGNVENGREFSIVYSKCDSITEVLQIANAAKECNCQ
jgi:hypothetical protein